MDDQVRTTDLRRLFWATICFAWGGLMLLAWSPYWFFFCFGSWPVVVLFAIGWYNLAAAVIRPDSPHSGPDERRLAQGILAASMGGFAISLVFSAPFVLNLPRYPGGWVSNFLFGVFLWVPSIYAPILIGNAVLFTIATHETTRIARPFLLAAATGLVEIAAIGVATQVLWTPAGWNFSILLFAILPGLTGPVYAVAAIGLWRQLRLVYGFGREAGAAPQG